MLIDHYDPDSYIYDMIELYIEKTFETLTQKSVIWLIIQGVLLAFSIWEKNSRFFVILAAIGIYSVHGSLSVRISLKRIETAVNRLCEIRSRQLERSLDTRKEKLSQNAQMFIPIKVWTSEGLSGEVKKYLKYNFFERRISLVQTGV